MTHPEQNTELAESLESCVRVDQLIMRNASRNPWDSGEQRKTPCCGGNAWLLDNMLNDAPGGSRWECDKCHRVWCWSSMIKVSA